MKVVLLTSDSPNQAALAQKIAAVLPLSAIIIEKKKLKAKRSLSIYTNAILDRTLLAPLRHAWFGMQEYYRGKYKYPEVETLTVSNINSKEAIDALNRIKPDLVMVSGTGMIKKDVLSLKFNLGIINLHTGLSPYVKGGPNCTNWCLSNNTLHLIGNTVMWIDAGIDSGDIVTTAFTSFTGDESLLEVHIKVMEHAHDLYIKAAKFIIDNNGNANRVKQSSIEKGSTFYTREWTALKKFKALQNFKKFKSTVNNSDYLKAQANIKTIPLNK